MNRTPSGSFKVRESINEFDAPPDDRGIIRRLFQRFRKKGGKLSRIPGTAYLFIWFVILFVWSDYIILAITPSANSLFIKEKSKQRDLDFLLELRVTANKVK